MTHEPEQAAVVDTDEMRALIDMAANVYLRASALLEKAGHTLVTPPPARLALVVSLDDARRDRRGA